MWQLHMQSSWWHWSDVDGCRVPFSTLLHDLLKVLEHNLEPSSEGIPEESTRYKQVQLGTIIEINKLCERYGRVTSLQLSKRVRTHADVMTMKR